MNPNLVVLGATGSIGTQALEVAHNLGLDIVGLAARRPSKEFAEICKQTPDAAVVVVGGPTSEREWFEKDVPNQVVFGSEAILALASTSRATVMNGIVGAAGLPATLSALEAGNRVALANKESLVSGGPLVVSALEAGGELVPVDSEHSALHQCLLGELREDVDRIILTASGGPFRGASVEDLQTVTPEEALRHPTWDMGPRITIDSATMFNKGLEIIEAHYLFGVGYDRIDVVIHPQSILHSAVEFSDGSWKGHLGHPDMRLPIQYAITSPQRSKGLAGPFDLAGLTLTFEEPDRTAFPALDIARAAGKAGGTAPAVMNAADEIAVEAFLQGRLGFRGISEVVERTIDTIECTPVESVEHVFEVDGEARSVAASLIAGVC